METKYNHFCFGLFHYLYISLHKIGMYGVVNITKIYVFAGSSL